MKRAVYVAAAGAIGVAVLLWVILPPFGRPSSLSVVMAGIVTAVAIVAVALWFRLRAVETHMQRMERILQHSHPELHDHMLPDSTPVRDDRDPA